MSHKGPASKWVHSEGAEANGGPHIVREEHIEYQLGAMIGWHASDCWDCNESITEYINTLEKLAQDLRDVLLFDRESIPAIQRVVNAFDNFWHPAKEVDA